MKPDAENYQNLSPLARQVPWVGFGASLLFLILIAAVADRVTTRLESDQEYVSRSQDVERMLGRLRGDLLASEINRLLYVVTGNEHRLAPYYSASQRIPDDIEQLKLLTGDSPSQQKDIDDLRAIINRRDGALRELIAFKNSGGADVGKEESDLALVADLSNQAMNVVQQMRDNEDATLRQRQIISKHTYNLVRIILVTAFFAVVIMLVLTFRRLWVELRDRVQAETSVRKLNGRILQLQDTERRKVARELHDSIGQVLAAIKMNLSLLGDGDSTLPQEKKKEGISQIQELLEIGIAETRTLSHLLHPPLLDELGFSSAAQWLVDGFSKRSKIQVNLDIPKDIQRMPQEVELVLFRVLQESLTNIHRHSGSASADISLANNGARINLSVRDYGTGIPQTILENFRTTSVGLGVGLAGMRERVNELGGSLDLYSDLEGTVLRVTLPLFETGRIRTSGDHAAPN